MSQFWLLDETSLSSRISWECQQFLDIYAYFGFPWISWISRKSAYPWETQNILIHRKYKLSWEIACIWRNVPTDSTLVTKVKLWNFDFYQQFILFFVGKQPSNGKIKQKPKPPNKDKKKLNMITTIQLAVFQAIGSQILKKYPLDTVTFIGCGRTSLDPPQLFVVFSGITWRRHNNRCQAIINSSISFGVSCCYKHMQNRLTW